MGVGVSIDKCIIFRGKFPRIKSVKTLIPRKSFKAVYVTAATSNNVHGKKFLPSINMSSTWAKVGSDQLMNLTGGV